MAAKGSPPFIPPEVFPAFTPGDLCRLQSVVEQAWAELRKAERDPISPERAHLTRELLAHRVMSCAALGERDPELLKQHAVRGMTRSKRRHKDAA